MKTFTSLEAAIEFANYEQAQEIHFASVWKMPVDVRNMVYKSEFPEGTQYSVTNNHFGEYDNCVYAAI